MLQFIVGGNQRLRHQFSPGKLRALCQLLLHCVERGNVLQLPLQRRLAGKAHHQQRKAVPVHQVHGVRLACPGGVGSFKEHGGQSAILRFDILDCAKHVFVLLAEVLSNLAAGCHRLTVLGR